MRYEEIRNAHNPTCKGGDGWIACMFEEGIWSGASGSLTL